MITLLLLGIIGLCFLLKALVHAKQYGRCKEDFTKANTEYLRMFGGKEELNDAYKKMQRSLFETFTASALSTFFFWIMFQLLITGIWKML